MALYDQANVSVMTVANIAGVVVFAVGVGVPGCILTTNGIEYKGFQNRTIGNYTCQPWSSQTVSFT